MKIGLQTWGTDGDFFPFLALAVGLKNAGHEVTLVYTRVDSKNYPDSYAEDGITLIHARGTENDSRLPNPYAIDAKAGSFAEYSQLLEQFFDPHAEAMYEASDNLCANNDLVIGHAVCHTLLTASEKWNCPRISLVLTPIIVRSNSVAPIGRSLGTWANAFLWNVGSKLSTNSWFSTSRDIRKREGLPPVKSLQKELFTSPLLTLVAASPALITRPSDWTSTVRMTGFLMLPSAKSVWKKPEELKAFLDAGEPPIYMTFGSCMAFDLAESTALLIEAARYSKQRVIIQSDWEKVAKPTDSNIFCISHAPHTEVFAHCALIVHHGGAGTTQAALLAGKPSVVVAHGFDQPYWGQTLHAAGVGGKQLYRAEATAADIAQQIHSVLHSDAPQKAQHIGRKMALENGVAQAIEYIHGLEIIKESPSSNATLKKQTEKKVLLPSDK